MPFKRSKHLLELSRDHHTGLLFCWKIKEGIKLNVPFWRIDKYIIYFWDAHLKNHFEEEEQLLICLADTPYCCKAKLEHKEPAAWIHAADGNTLRTKDEYLLFAESMIHHIRFEERELFPNLEKGLPPELLARVGLSLSNLHQIPFTDDYKDDFWMQDRTIKKEYI